MPITYDAATNTITVTGYTEATPCTFLDVYNADVAGGWGVVTRQCTDQYCFDALVTIGDGSTATWFADTLKQVIFQDGILTANDIPYFQVKNNAHLRFGIVIDASDKSSKDGCTFLTKEDSYMPLWIKGETTDDVRIYSSWFQAWLLFGGEVRGIYFHTLHSAKIWHTSHGPIRYVDINSELYNSIIQETGYFSIQSEASWDRCFCAHATVYGFYLRGTTQVTLKNMILRDMPKLAYAKYMNADHFLVNIDSDNWTFNWYSSSGKIYRQYEFDLKVQDKDENAISGATVKIWDKDDNLVTNVTTGADGKIATQTLNYGYYNQAGGDTPTMQTPHTIEISKAGYQTYKKKFTVDEKISWRIRLLQANPVQFLEDKPILQLCPESQEDDAILFVPV